MMKQKKEFATVGEWRASERFDSDMQSIRMWKAAMSIALVNAETTESSCLLMAELSEVGDNAARILAWVRLLVSKIEEVA